MKVAISQPMKNRSQKEILEERARIAAKLQDMGFEVVNAIIEFDDTKLPMYHLGESIKKMAEADAIVFLPGWEFARGCDIEHQVAEDYHKIIITLPREDI